MPEPDTKIIEEIEKLRRQVATLEADLDGSRADTEQYRTILTNMSQFIYQIDRQGKFVFANEKFLNFYKLTLDNLLGRTLADFFPPEVAARIIAEDDKVMESGCSCSSIKSYSDSSSDETRYVEIVRVPLFTKDNCVAGMQGIYWDVTDRKKMETALEYYAFRLEKITEIHRAALIFDSIEDVVQKALENLRELVECQRVSVMVYDYHDMTGKFLAVDSAQPIKEGAGAVMPFRPENFAPEFKAGKPVIVNNLADLPVKSESEKQLIRAGIACYLSAPLMIDGKLAGALSFSSDQPKVFTDEHKAIAQEVATILAIVTQQHRLRQEVEMQSRRLKELHKIDLAILSAQSTEEIASEVVSHMRGLLNCDRASILLFDEDSQTGKLLAVDTSLETGLTQGVVLTYQEIGDIDRLRMGKIVVLNEIKPGNDILPTDLRLLEEGLHSYACIPLMVEDKLIGSLNFVYQKANSITERELQIATEATIPLAIAIRQSQLQEKIKQYAVELESRVIKRTAQLEEANLELEAFSYSVSHDLRSPLRAVEGFSSILSEDYSSSLEAEALDYLKRIQRAAKKMDLLLSDLLTFSRTNRRNIEKERISPKGLILQVLENLNNEQEGRDLEIRFGEMEPCLADPALIKQVYLNLLSNAFKFSRHRSPAIIELGGYRQGKEMVYFVKDNGVGFDMQYAGKLFGVFQRLHGLEEFEGTGAGLAIVQRIIHRHGGRVWAEAMPELGATFYFSLPLETNPE